MSHRPPPEFSQIQALPLLSARKNRSQCTAVSKLPQSGQHLAFKTLPGPHPRLFFSLQQKNQLQELKSTVRSHG